MANQETSLTGEVLMPSGKSAQPLITDNLDGTVTVQYSPTEAGLHEMHIKYNGTHIPGKHIHSCGISTMTRPLIVITTELAPHRGLGLSG